MITKPNIEEIVERDLIDLIESGACEGLYLDFKEASYGPTDADKRELLKDVSAFANSHGGHLIIGISEAGGVAADLRGIESKDIDAEVQRLGQIILTGIEPRIHGCRVKSVKLSSDRHCIVIRVPRSWRSPHRICAQNVNRYWIRNSSGCHEASMDELRTLFGQAASFIERARLFRKERMDHILQPVGSRPLAGQGRLIVHLIPFAAFQNADLLDPEAIYGVHGEFLPMGSMGMSPRFNFEGVLNERGGEVNFGYTQIFRNGIVEATKSGIIHEARGKSCISGITLESHFFAKLVPYVNGLKRLGVDPPIMVMISLEGVSGSYYIVSNAPWFDDLIPIDRDQLLLPECVITEYAPAESYHMSLRPAFDALWNAAGYSKSQFFNDAGLWIGPSHG